MTTRVAALGGAVLTVAGLFLPWVRGSADLTGLEAFADPRHGPRFLALAAVLPVVLVAAVRPTARGRLRLAAGAAGLGAIAFGLALVLLAHPVLVIVEAGPDGTGGGVVRADYRPGLGVLVTSVGLAAVLASAPLIRRRARPS